MPSDAESKGRQARGKPRGLRRDRDCSTCKARNVKCDLNRPQCHPCVQAGLACGGYPQRVIWTGEPTPKKTSPRTSRGKSNNRIRNEALVQSFRLTSPLADQAQGADARLQANLGSSDRMNQNSFISRLATFCYQIRSMEDQSRARSQYLTPEAIRLVSHLCDFIDARTHAQSAKVLRGGESLESADEASHRLEALAGLIDALKTANPFAIIGIAAFTLFEVFDSAFGDWQRHLYGARSLLDHHCQSQSQLDELSQAVTGLTEIVARLAWLDMAGAIVKEGTGLIFDDWHRQVLDDDFFTSVGCPADAFDLYVSVAKGEVPSDPLGSCFRAMDELLKLKTDHQTDWGQSANAHYCAAAIAVLAQIRDEKTATHRDTLLASTVDRLCQILALTPTSSMYYIHMALTVYLAGIHAVTSKHCDIVRAYWKDCSIAGVPRYRTGLEVCEIKWKEKGLA